MARPPFQVAEFVRQKEILTPVLRLQDGALARAEPMPHYLFIGASGLGKSLAARVLAERSHAPLAKFTGPENA